MTKKPKAGALFSAPKPDPMPEAAATGQRVHVSSDPRPHRDGRKSLTVWFPEDAVRQLKTLAATEGVTMQAKMAEIVNREFARKSLPEIAK